MSDGTAAAPDSDSVLSEDTPFELQLENETTTLLKEFVESPCSVFIESIVRLEQLVDPYNTPPLPSNSIEREKFLKDRELAKFELQKAFCALARYQTTGTLKSFWNYLTSKSNQSWSDISSDVKRNLDQQISTLLHWWSVLSSSSHELSDNPSQDKSGVDSVSDEELVIKIENTEPLKGYFVIEDQTMYCEFNSETSTFTFKNSHVAEDGDEPKHLSIASSVQMEEEIKEDFYHTFYIHTPDGNTHKFTIPFPQKFQGKRFIQSIKSAFSKSILDAMRGNPRDEELQEQFLKSLYQYTHLSKPERMSLAKAGAVRRIIDSMNSFPRNYQIQLCALGTLHTLTEKMDYTKLLIGREGGIDSILQAMQIFRSDVAFQMLACKSLQQLAFGVEYNKVLIGNLKGIATILDSMNIFKHEPELLQICIGALANLSSSDDANKNTIVGEGGIPLITGAMTEFASEFGIQYYGLGALVNISTNDNAKEMLLNEGIVEILVKILRNFAKNEQLLYRATCVMQILVNSADFKAKMQEKGGVEALKEISGNFPQVSEFSTAASEVLQLMQSS